MGIYMIDGRKILVTGGAGFVGSHLVKALNKAGCDVTVFDNLSTGHRDSVPDAAFVFGDLASIEDLDRLFSANQFHGVMHLAALSLVGESSQNPAMYYSNNVAGSINLLNAMIKHKVENVVFSSSAAVYGEPLLDVITEDHPKQPVNVYGRSKLMVETVLNDYATGYGLNSISLRYFNAAGADFEGLIGERHEPETHLIPLVLQVASGRRELIKIYGTDYPTLDGTCVRDYVHVLDICHAHEQAISALVNGLIKGGHALNLGNGRGFSVFEVIESAQKIVGEQGFNIKFMEADRRLGDPAVLVAEASMARKQLGWYPRYSDINTIIQTAWDWEKTYNY